MLKKMLVLSLIAAATALPAQAQDSAAGNQAALPDVTSGLGMFVYAANNQDAHQQSMDELECYAWSQEKSGINPMNIDANADAAAAAAASATADATKGAAVAGAAKGALVGAAVGEITSDDAGAGAAVGAIGGAIRGRRAKKKAEKQAAQAAAAQAEAAAAEKLDTFKRGMSVCLEGRGYSVK